MRSLPTERESWRLEERRKESRFTMILRAGIIEQQGKSSFCLVKNISTTGVLIKLYAAAVDDTDAILRIADEHPIGGHVIWVTPAAAGISFHEELDPASLLRVRQKLRPNQRRSVPRMNVGAAATIRAQGRKLRAVVTDISSFGARVRSSALVAGNRLVIELADLPSIEAFVRWSDGEEAGLVFQTPVPMQIVAQWIEARRGSSNLSGPVSNFGVEHES